MSYTIYIMPSQIETFTLETTSNGTITNESDISTKSGNWKVVLPTGGSNEVVTLSSPGYKTKTVTLHSSNADNICLTPKKMYAWVCDDTSGATIYTATKTPTTDTIFYTDFFDSDGNSLLNGSVTTDNGTAYIGAYDTEIQSASETEIVARSYTEPS